MSDVGMLLNQTYNFNEGVNEEKDEIILTESKSGDKKLKVIKIIFLILCILLVGELIAYRYVLPSFASPKVTIRGNKVYSAEEIASKFVPMHCTSWFDFDVEEGVSILSSDPGIDSVVIEKKFPNKIFVDVVERIPVAVTFIVENGYTYPMQIDRSGVLFPVKNASVLDSKLIPIISGLPVEHMSGGMRVPGKYRPLIDQIAEIGLTQKNYFASISEICVLPKEHGNFELALIPSQSKVRVLTDRSLNEDALKYMMVVLDVVNLLDTEVSEIDLRYGSVSCKMK